MTRLLLLLLLPLAACDVSLPSASSDLPLLGDDAIAVAGRIYMLAPASDSVVEIDPAARTFTSLPAGAAPRVLSRKPGADVVYALGLAENTMTRIAPAGSSTADTGAPFNRLDWAPDGSRGFLWIDPAGIQPDVEGSLNLGAYAVLRDDEDGVSLTPGRLTFQPLSVVFSADSGRALVTTSSRLHVLDLTVDPFEERTVPLTTDPSIRRTPDLVVPTPDGTRALVTAQGGRDLFVLSLDPVLVENVIALPRQAMDIQLDRAGTRAMIADGSSTVTFLDLDTFADDALALPHPVTTILPSRNEGDDFVLLYDDRGASTFLTRADLDEGAAVPDDPDTYLLEGVVRSVWLEPGEQAAIIFHDGGGSSVDFVPSQSLSLFSFAERAPSRVLLDAPAVDVAFLAAGVVPGSDDPHAVVVLSDSARLVRYNLRDYSQVVLDTYAAPLSIGRAPPEEGGSEQLFVVHRSDLGLISFVDPAAQTEPPGGFPAVAGMADAGLLEVR
jgi:hypothetical protein